MYVSRSACPSHFGRDPPTYAGESRRNADEKLGPWTPSWHVRSSSTPGRSRPDPLDAEAAQMAAFAQSRVQLVPGCKNRRSAGSIAS